MKNVEERFVKPVFVLFEKNRREFSIIQRILSFFYKFLMEAIDIRREKYII